MLNFRNFVLCDQVPVAGSGASSLMMMFFFFLAFWLLLIAPQRKRQKAQEKMLAALKEGDEVMSTAGIMGSIVQVKGDRVIIKTGDSKVELHKSFIQAKLSDTKSK